jgi:hypothetical protein
MFLLRKVTLAFPVKYLKSYPETRGHVPTLFPLPYRMASPEILDRHGVLGDLLLWFLKALSTHIEWTLITFSEPAVHISER